MFLTFFVLLFYFSFWLVLVTAISTQNSFDIVAVFGNKVKRCFNIVAGVDGALQLTVVSLNPCDITVFQDGGRRLIGFLKISNFSRSERLRRSNCISVPNFVEIARTAAEICEFRYYASLA